MGVRGRFYGQNPSKFPDHPPAQPPLVSVQYGVGPTALAFNAPTNEFGATGGDLFMACWGPDWLFNRGSIVRGRLLRQPGGAYRAQEFPFAHEVPKVTALAFAANGDLYATLFGREVPGHQPSPMADGAIYRFLPAAWVEPGAAVQSKFPFVKGNVGLGKKLFEERGCAACHSLGGRSAEPHSQAIREYQVGTRNAGGEDHRRRGFSGADAGFQRRGDHFGDGRKPARPRAPEQDRLGASATHFSHAGRAAGWAERVADQRPPGLPRGA